MLDEDDDPTDLTQLAVPQVGSLVATGDPFQPYHLLDAARRPLRAADAYFAELIACGRPATTQRSYGMDLVRWFRFLSAVGVAWDKASRLEARDFCRWLATARKPSRPHWRRPADLPARREPSAPNALTGKCPPGPGYAPATVAHAESVLRAFYDFHLEVGTGPMVNPFPLVRGARRGRADAHHNPLEPFGKTRSRPLPAEDHRARPSDDPRRGFRPVVRQALLAPRPGARRLLRLRRRARPRSCSAPRSATPTRAVSS